MPMKTPKEQQLVNKELTHKLFSRVEEVCHKCACLKTLSTCRSRKDGGHSFVVRVIALLPAAATCWQDCR